MLFRLTFLIFIFSTIIAATANADDSNPSSNLKHNSNSNIVIITVPLITAAQTDNSNLDSNTVATLVGLTKNKLEKSNLIPNPRPNRQYHNPNQVVIKSQNTSLAIYNAYLKLERRENKRLNNATIKWNKKSSKYKN